MATGELAGLAKQFAPVFGSMGKTIATFVSAAGAAFLTWGASAVGVLAALWAAWKLLGFGIDLVKAGLKGVVQLFRDSIAVGTKFQNTITLVSVAANQSADAFAEISIAASLVGVSTLKAARGFETMIRSGLTGREALVVFKDLALFSRAIGERMSATASVLVGAMRAFQIEAKNANRVLAVFSFAILKTRFNFATFSTAFAFGGAAAAGFGRQLEETVAVMSRLFNMGLRASTVGTTLRNMLTRLANPTEKARVALLRYGITLEKLNPLTNRWSELLVNLRPLVGQLGDLTQIFGRRTAGFISRLLQQIDPAGKFIEDLATKIEKTTVLIDDVMRRRLGTAAGQLEVFVSQWEATKVQLFGIIEPIITELFFEFNQALFSVRQTIKSVTPSLSRILVDAFKIVRSAGSQLVASMEFVVNVWTLFIPACHD
jgi:TP901 family phage tail tape measure protein